MNPDILRMNAILLDRLDEIWAIVGQLETALGENRAQALADVKASLKSLSAATSGQLFPEAVSKPFAAGGSLDNPPLVEYNF